MLISQYLDYADIMYDKSTNLNFEAKSERTQYYACLEATGAIQQTIRDCIYKELALKSVGWKIASEITFFLQNSTWSSQRHLKK